MCEQYIIIYIINIKRQCLLSRTIQSIHQLAMLFHEINAYIEHLDQSIPYSTTKLNLSLTTLIHTPHLLWSFGPPYAIEMGFTHQMRHAKFLKSNLSNIYSPFSNPSFSVIRFVLASVWFALTLWRFRRTLGATWWLGAVWRLRATGRRLGVTAALRSGSAPGFAPRLAARPAVGRATTAPWPTSAATPRPWMARPWPTSRPWSWVAKKKSYNSWYFQNSNTGYY